MKPLKMHRLADESTLQMIRQRILDLNADRRERLLMAAERTSRRYRGLMESSLEAAGLGLALQLDDETVRADLNEAAGAAQAWLEMPHTPANAGLPSTYVDAVVDRPTGRTSFKTTRIAAPQPPPSARDGWHILVFDTALETLLAFGPPQAAHLAAGAQEAWYRSVEVTAEEAWFADVRARKRWVLGDDAGARTACMEAVNTARESLFRGTSGALLALMEGDSDAFHEALADMLKAHKRLHARRPDDGMGAFCLPALALCRIARSYAIHVQETTYLPVRFLAPSTLRG